MISIPADCRFEFGSETGGPVGMDPSSAYVGYRHARKRWRSGDTGTVHRTDDDERPYPRSVSYRIVFDAISGMDVVIQDLPEPLEVATMLDMVATCLMALISRDAGPEADIDPVEMAIALAETARNRPHATLGVASAAMPWSPMQAFHRDSSGRPWPMDVSAEKTACAEASVPPALRIDYHAPGRNASLRIGRLSVLSPDARGTPLDPMTVLRSMRTLERLRTRTTGEHGDPA